LNPQVVTEPADRRKLVLEAAERLFGHYGPLKTTMSDIARAAGVGVGSLYLDFASKNEILEALSVAQHGSVLEAERRAWGEGGPAPARLERVFTVRFETFVEFGYKEPHARDLFFCGCTPIEEAHRRFCEQEHELLCVFLSEAQKAGELTVDEPASIASALLRSYASFAPPLLFREKTDRLRRELAAMHRLMLRGLLPR
jgi:AcrR family transcriptional regulator